MFELGAAAVKILTPAATAVGRAALSSRTHRLRTAWHAHGKAKQAGIRISRTGIYTWLARTDTKDLIGSANLAQSPSALSALALRLNSEPTQSRVEHLFGIIVTAFISRLPASEATAVAHDRMTAQLGHQAQAISSAINDATQTLTERVDAGRGFNESLRQLNPSRADSAHRIRELSPIIETAVDRLASADDKATALRDWAHVAPSWLEASGAEVLTWLAEVALDYGQREAARAYLERALLLGASPRDYWVTRRAQAIASVNTVQAQAELKNVDHPLAQALHLGWDGDHEGALVRLGEWTPSRREDVALKALLEASLESALGNYSKALSIAEAASETFPDATSLMLLAAEMLLVRASNHESATKLHDASRALDLATRARNARRAWGGDSAEAAILALKAANMSGDPDQAWRISQPQPDGEATATEASDQRMLADAAFTAALTGRTETARRLQNQVSDEFEREHLSAILAQEQADAEAAQEHFLKAWSLASTPMQRLTALRGLAVLGVALPEHAELKLEFPELMDEIEAISAAMSQAGDRTAKLRAGAHKSVFLAVEFAKHLDAEGQSFEAGQALSKAAEQWAHPTLMAMAADAFYQSGDLRRARDATVSSMTLGGASWPGRKGAYVRLLRISVDEQRWELASEAARGLVQLDANDDEALWALIKSLVQLGKPRDAWHTMTSRGEPAAPRTSDEANIWINLHARFAPKARYLSAALDVLKPWIEDESVVGTFIPVLYFGLQHRGFEPDPDELKTLHDVQSEFLEKFPDSRYFRAISSDDEKGAVEQVFAIVKESHPPEVDALFKSVERGELPLGTLTMMGRTYAEAALHRAAGGVWCATPDWMSTSGNISLSGRVVLDTTAARTLTVLDADIRDRLLASFSDVRVPDRLFRDANAARDSLSVKASLSVSWDHESDQPRIQDISDDDAERLKRDSQTLVSILESTTRVPIREFTTLPDGLRAETWLSAVELATVDGLPLWSDDRVLSALAESQGVETLSTPRLLARAVQADRLTRDEFEVSLALLIQDFAVDLGFQAKPMELAAELDGWQARGAANALRQPGCWVVPEDTLSFLMRALAEAQTVGPEALSGWFASGCLGLARVAGNPAPAAANLHLLLDRTFSQPWVRPSEVPFLLDGLRAAVSQLPSMPDPLEGAITSLFQALTKAHDPSVAAKVLLWLFALCREADRNLVARVILTL